MIRKWKMPEKRSDIDEIGCIFKDESWQILLKIRSISCKNASI